MHLSLDGFVAGPNGEMNWIKVDEEIFTPWLLFSSTNHTNRKDSSLYFPLSICRIFLSTKKTAGTNFV